MQMSCSTVHICGLSKLRQNLERLIGGDICLEIVKRLNAGACFLTFKID